MTAQHIQMVRFWVVISAEDKPRFDDRAHRTTDAWTFDLEQTDDTSRWQGEVSYTARSSGRFMLARLLTEA
ncbi:MAG TPA: hypothetical protein VIG48_03695, partial [Jatrophihabitans sp.]